MAASTSRKFERSSKIRAESSEQHRPSSAVAALSTLHGPQCRRKSARFAAAALLAASGAGPRAVQRNKEGKNMGMDLFGAVSGISRPLWPEPRGAPSLGRGQHGAEPGDLSSPGHLTCHVSKATRGLTYSVYKVVISVLYSSVTLKHVEKPARRNKSVLLPHVHILPPTLKT